MSDGDETRVLNMRINNKQFLKGAADSLRALTTLNKGIDNSAKGKGMQGLGQSVDTVKTRFGALQVAGVTALANITNRAVNAGLSMVKALTISPVMDGFREYEKLLTSTQTIMANTGKSAKQVAVYLDDLNNYSDQTIYNFGQMADSIGKFTAAGVSLKDATSSIKGLANSAALAGSDTNQLNTAMYQMSQALATGTIKLMDWNSLSNAGMGGKNMQESLKATARTMGDNGKAMDDAITKQGSFRDSLRDGWLSADVFNKTMKVMAGVTDETTGKTVAYSAAQLEAMGYNAKNAKELSKLSGAAIQSATKIKTFSQLMDVVKESIGSGWAGIFRSLFGNLEESGEMWTNVGNKVTGAVDKIFGGVGKMLAQWRELGGFEKMWGGIGNIFKALGNLISPVIALFQAFMPAGDGAGNTMYSLTDAFYKFSVWLEKVTRGAESLTPIIQGVADKFKDLFGGVGDATGEGSKIAGIFSTLASVLGPIVDRIKDSIGDMVGFIFDEMGKMDSLDWGNLLTILAGGAIAIGVRKIGKAFSGLLDNLNGVGGIFDSLTGSLTTMQNAIKAKSLMNIAIAVGVLTASMLILSTIPAEDSAKGIASLASMMGLMVGALAGLGKISGMFSIPVLAASLIALSTALLILSVAVAAFGNMKTETLVKGFAAIGTALTLLTVAVAALTLIQGPMIRSAVSLTILSAALTMLAGTIALYSLMDWSTVAGGLLKMGAGIVILGTAMRTMPKGMLLQAVALTILAGAISILAGAIKVLSGIGLKQMAIAVGGLIVTLLALAGATALMQGMIGGAVALAMVSSSVTLLAGALKVLSTMSPKEIATALIALAGALTVIIVAGYAAMGAAPGLLVLAIAMTAIGIAMSAIGVGMLAFSAGLALLVTVGAAGIALLVAAIMAVVALLPSIAAAMAAALVSFIESIAEAAPKIAEAVVKIGDALLDAFDALIPRMVESGVKLITALIEGITELVPTVVNAINDMVIQILEDLEEDLPQMVKAGTDLIVSFLEGLQAAMPRIATEAGETVVAFLEALNQAVITYTPRIVALGREIGQNLILGIIQGLIPEPILTAINWLVDRVVTFFKGLLGIQSPSTVFAGFGGDIVAGLGKGIISAIGSATGAISRLGGRIVSAAASIPGKIGGAFKSLGGILSSTIGSAFRSAVSAVNNAIQNISQAASKLPGMIRGIASKVGKAAEAIGKSIVDGIGRGVAKIGSWVSDIGGALKNAINGALGLPKRIGININKGPIKINTGVTIPAFAKGVTNFGGGAALVGEAGPEVVTMGRGSNVITNKNIMGFMKQVARLTQALSSGKAQNSPGGSIQYVVSADFRGDPRTSGTQFAANLTAGLVTGLQSNQPAVNSAMAGVGTGMATTFANVLEINSPSKVFQRFAGFVGQGFINGLVASVDGVRRAATSMGNAAILAIAKTITDGQLRLEALRGKAEAYANAAEAVRAKERATKNKAAKKRLDKEADKLEKRAKSEANAAAKQQARVEAQNAAAERAEQYQNSDTSGKSEMRKEDAANAAAAASAARQNAIRLAKEADLVRKKDKKRAKALDAQAKAQLANAKNLANVSTQYAQEAYRLAIQAKQEAEAEEKKQAAEDAEALRKQLQSVTAEDISKAQAAYDKYAKEFAAAQPAIQKDAQPSEFKFEQHLHSPEAISPSDAWREGKSLVSLAERKLTVPTP